MNVQSPAMGMEKSWKNAVLRRLRIVAGGLPHMSKFSPFQQPAAQPSRRAYVLHWAAISLAPYGNGFRILFIVRSFFDFTLYTLYGIFMGMWQIEMEPIKDWLDGLDKQTAYQVYAALDLLRERGPNLKRPLVGKIEGSIIGSMKELRPGSVGRSEVRILFVFDPERKAVMLVGGDKQNKWNKWYKTAIREAERRYIRWLEEQHGKDTK